MTTRGVRSHIWSANGRCSRPWPRVSGPGVWVCGRCSPNRATRGSAGRLSIEWESFNGKRRVDLLNGEIFSSEKEAKVVIESWRRHYNAVRPQI